MTEIIERINTLYEAMKLKDAELVKLITKAKIQLAELDNTKERLNQHKVSLDEREMKLGRIENSVELKKQADRMMLAAQEETQKIAKDRADFIMWAEKERADIANCRKGIDSGIEAIKERESQIEKEKKQLALDKLTYRESIIREIGRMTNANT